MAMATGGAGASALIMALNSAKTVKSTKAMLDNTKELNKAQENGALQSFNQMLSGLQNTGPIQSALSVLFAQIQAGTTESTVGLMKDMLDLFMSPGGAASIKTVITLLNLLIDGSATIIRIIDKVLDLLGVGESTPQELSFSDMAGGPTPSATSHSIDYTNPAYVDVPTYHPGIQEYG